MFDDTCSSKVSGTQAKFCSAAKAEIICFSILMTYFGVKAMYFALRIRERIFPDEISWYGMVQVFSRSRFLPVDSPESYPFGLVTHIPTLYFFVMGKVLTLNVFGINDLFFLRVVNVGIGVVTILFAWRLCCLLTDQVLVRLLFLTMLTNTLMFTFLFGAVSYDNLANLFAVMAFYFFCLFSLRRQVLSLQFALISVLAGCLTKVTFLPLALLFAIALFWRERGSIQNVRKYIGTIFSLTIIKSQLIAWLVIVVMAGAGVTLYGGNWLKYSQLSPGSEAILSLENALKYRIAARNYVLGSYKKDSISLLEAQRLALQIREEADRQDTLMLLDIAREEKNRKTSIEPVMGRLEYSLAWLGAVFSKTFGILAHKSMPKEGWKEMGPYYTFVVIALFGFFLRARDGLTGLKNCGFQLLFVTCGYLFILMQFVNYSIYQAAGVLNLALQGRYTFPVLVPFYILCAYYFVVAWPQRLRLWLTATLGVFFVSGEFPWFLQQVTPDWFF